MGQEHPSEGVPAFIQVGDQILRQHGYRLTPQRHLILQVLRDTQGHLTIEQLLERARQQYPSVTLSTVYRTVHLLKDLQLVREIHFQGEAVAYEVFTGKTHHHLVCRRCGSISHLDISLQHVLYESVQEQSSFHNITMDIMSTGDCNTCWAQQQKSTKDQFEGALTSAVRERTT